MMRVLVVLGTRPEAIKLAPVVAELRRSRLVDVEVCATGQHQRMLDEACEFLDLHPRWDLEVMREGQELAELSSRLLPALDRVLVEWSPEVVIVQGDTTSTLMAALAAFYRRTRVAHVEAGLRTGRMDAPFPEEANRRLVAPLAHLSLAPTEHARDALLNEGASGVHLVGNTIVDAVHNMCARLDADPQLIAGASDEYLPPGLREEIDAGAPLVMVTCHRRESFGTGLQQIASALADLAGAYMDTQFLLPVHPNPNVEQPLRDALEGVGNLHLLQPLPHPLFLGLLRRSVLVLSDSGGVQEEAVTLGVPLLIMREVTERTEAVEAGAARLVGAESARILKASRELLDSEAARRGMRAAQNPFGDGCAALRIARLVGAEDLPAPPRYPST